MKNILATILKISRNKFFLTFGVILFFTESMLVLCGVLTISDWMVGIFLLFISAGYLDDLLLEINLSNTTYEQDKNGIYISTKSLKNYLDYLLKLNLIPGDTVSIGEQKFYIVEEEN